MPITKLREANTEIVEPVHTIKQQTASENNSQTTVHIERKGFYA